MQNRTFRLLRLSCILMMLPAAATVPSAWAQQGTVYKCPGNNFTNTLTPAQARQQGCTEVTGGNLTVIEGSPRPASPAAAAPARAADTKVPPTVQRERDAEARRVLERELAAQEAQLAALQKEFNAGEPERRGDERNYQRYLDRVEQLKADIARKQADVNALRRELSKLPPPLP